MPDKDGKETKKEYFERMRQEEKAARDKKIQESMNDAALEQWYNDHPNADVSEIGEIMGLLGTYDRDSLREAVEEADPDVAKIMDKLFDKKKLSNSETKKLQGRQGKKAINAGKKKAKKKGCLSVFAGLAAAGAATAYGMYEGVSAIASALF